jgi:putative heme-binding domain-containing protein
MPNTEIRMPKECRIPNAEYRTRPERTFGFRISDFFRDSECGSLWQHSVTADVSRLISKRNQSELTFAATIVKSLCPLWLTVVSAFCLSAQNPALVAVPGLGVSAPPGFEVSLLASGPLAHDIRAMTINRRGELVVGGPGFIKVLHPPATNGPATGATLFAAPEGTVTDLCFDGTGLFTVMDGSVYLYRDNDSDGQADDLPTKMFETQPAKAGLRTVRQGPDGRWYLLAGWEADISRGHATSDTSPIRLPEGGVLLRASPDWQNTEILAHGFRQPAGLAFDWRGGIFTFDDEGAAERQLPGYQPARFFQVGYGLHHGWRPSEPDHLRAWPDYYADLAPDLYAFGPAKPSGVECYQHWQFPLRYHEGLFALDWAYGRVIHVPLTPVGSTYAGAAEPFLEPTGRFGFAPTALCVAPDGALLVAAGGRGLGGAIYRVQYLGADALDRDVLRLLLDTQLLEQVLRAPQPLAAWSMEQWVPQAQRLGPAPFSGAAVDTMRPVLDRVRAVEILTRLFDGLAPRTVQTLARDAIPELRARVAWSLARQPGEHFTGVLVGLAMDNHPLPRRAALEALLERYLDLDGTSLVPVCEANLGHPDKAVRLLAARLASRLPVAAWNTLRKNSAAGTVPQRLGLALAGLWRESDRGFRPETLDLALGAWNATGDLDLRLDAVRIMILALGDIHPDNPSREIFAAYEPAVALADHKAALIRMRQLVRTAFPSANPLLNLEVTRLLAMVEEDDPQLPRRVLAQITAPSLAPRDFHYLTVLARLPGPRAAEVTTRTAAALTGLDRKLAGRRPGAEWEPRLVELAAGLFRQDPALMETVLREPDFVREGNLPLVALMAPAQQLRAAGLFHGAALRNPAFGWSPELVNLLAKLPPEQTATLFRRQWAGSTWREELTVQLARKPEAADYSIFLAGLDSTHFPVAETCVRALLALPRQEAPKDLAPLLRLLSRLEYVPNQAALRALVMELLNRQSGQQFALREDGQGQENLPRLYQPVHAWFAAAYPTLAASAEDATGKDPVNLLSQILAKVPWSKGRPERGAEILNRRGCADCHAAPEAVGPDLAEVARRLSPDVFFQEVAAPGRHVAEAYRATEFRLRNQPAITGLVMYEREDVCLLRSIAGTPVRLLAGEVLSRRKVPVSIMPTGLLQGMTPQEMADLMACLKSLPAPAK